MSRNALLAVGLSALILLAGCGGGTQGTPTPTSPTATPTATPEPTETPTATATPEPTETPGGGAETGTLSFYISDQPTAIDEFEHLNATITKVGLHRSNATNDSEGSAGWIEHDVDNVTVDLTELQGKRATELDQFDVPNGSYTKVFIYVSAVNGTLADGNATDVKLPSGKLQMNTNFRVGAGEEVDFVFDVSVVKAGQSGKYILKPVVSESGADRDFDEVDATIPPTRERTRLNLSLSGDVVAGENVTLRVMRNGSAVENATVYVNDDEVGQTNASGEFTLTVPDEKRLRIRVEADDAEARLNRQIRSQEGTPTATPTATPTPTPTPTPS